MSVTINMTTVYKICEMQILASGFQKTYMSRLQTHKIESQKQARNYLNY